MPFVKKVVLQRAEELAKTNLGMEPSGHDYLHVKRVVAMAKKIAKATDEPVDEFVLELACWLHDIDDRKIVYKQGHVTVSDFFSKEKVPVYFVDLVNDIIANISYTSYLKGSHETSIEGKIAQDADRLDAIGAIGIARAFAYGGAKGRLIYDERGEEDTTRAHFDAKLLKLENLMNTEMGTKLARERTAFMEKYLDEFAAETKI